MDGFSVAETARAMRGRRTSVVGKGGGGRSAEGPAWGALPPAADWGEQQRSSQQLSWWRGTSSSPSAAVEPRARGGQASARATTGWRAEDARQKAGVAGLSRREEKKRRNSRNRHDEPPTQGLGGPRNDPDWNEQQQHSDPYASASVGGRARHDDARVDHGRRDLGYTGGSTENSREPRHPVGGGGGAEARTTSSTTSTSTTSSGRPADQLPDYLRDHNRNDWQRGGPPPSSTASAWPAPSAAGQVGAGSRRSAASPFAASSSSSSGFLPPAADWTEQRSTEEMAWWRGTRKAPSAAAQQPQRSRTGTGAPRDDLPRTASPRSAAAASSGDHHRHSDDGHEQQQQQPKDSVEPPSRARGHASDCPPPGRAEPLPPEPPHWRKQGTSFRDEPPPRKGGDRARDASRKASEPIAPIGGGRWDARSRGGAGGGRGVWSPAAGKDLSMEGAEAHLRASEGESYEQRYFVELPGNPRARGKGGSPVRTPQAPRLVGYSPDIDNWAWAPEPRRRSRTPHGEEQEELQLQADDHRRGDVLSKRGGLTEKRSPSVGLQAEAHPLLEEAGTIADLWRLLHPSLGVRVGSSASSSSADPFPSVSQPRRSGRVAESSDGIRAAEATFARRFYRKHGISGGLQQQQQQQGQRRRRGGWCCPFCRHASRRPAPDCPVCRHFPAAASFLAGRSSVVGLTARERPASKWADVGADEALLRRKSRRMGVNPLERNKTGLYLRQHLKEMRGDLALIRRQARDLDLLYYQRHPDAPRPLARVSSSSAEPETDHLDEDDDDEDTAAEDYDEDGEEESEQDRTLREKVEREAREKERELDRKRWAEEKARDLEEKRRRQEEIDRRRRQEERLEREREREETRRKEEEEEAEREAERQRRRREREKEEEEEEEVEAEKERERKKKMRRRQRQQQQQKEAAAAEEAEAERKKAARKKAQQQQQQQQQQQAAEKQQKAAEDEDKRRQRREKERRDAAEEQHERKSSSSKATTKAQEKDVASDAEEDDEDAVETSRERKTKKTRKTSSSGAEVDRTSGAKKKKKKKKKGTTTKKTRRKRADTGAEESGRESATETEDEGTTSSAAEEESETEADEPTVAPVVAAPVLPPKPSLETGFRIADIEISGSPPATALATGSPVQEAPRGKNLRSRLKERIQNRADTLVFVGKDTFFAKNIDKVPFPELPSDFQVNDRQRREEKELQMLKPVITDFTLPATYDEGWYRARVPLVVKVQTAVRGRLARRRYSKHKERKKIAYEIFTTEKNYMEALAHLHECRRKLEEESKAKVKADKIKVIWQDQLVDMIELARILTARLEAKVAPGAWHVSRELSDVFLDLGPRFAVYVPYIIHYNEALEALQELTKANKRFQQFSEESSRAFRFLDFAAILIMPIQRIPRYILLLKALIKITPRSHPDYDQLNKALDLMSTIATDINNQVKKYENHLTVCKIASLLVPRIKEFVQPDREFVGSGMVIMYDDKKKLRRNKQKVRTVFLFSDVFLLAKHMPASGVYHLKFMIYLNPSVHVEHNPYVKDVGNEHVDCVFRLHSDRADQSITLMTRTMDEKISWLIALEQTLFLIKDKQQPKPE